VQLFEKALSSSQGGDDTDVVQRNAGSRSAEPIL
jgi:hypothetical protein